MKHKHYEMIVAKASNMGLVCFVKRPDVEWVECDDRILPCIDEHEYFLCLPQHKDACLHWLNGGKSQVEYTKASYPYWCDIDSDEVNWTAGHIFMDELLNIRIKPKKEKRWIIWNENQDSYHCTFLVDPSDKYEANFKFSIHEIEVEV